MHHRHECSSEIGKHSRSGCVFGARLQRGSLVCACRDFVHFCTPWCPRYRFRCVDMRMCVHTYTNMKLIIFVHVLFRWSWLAPTRFCTSSLELSSPWICALAVFWTARRCPMSIPERLMRNGCPLARQGLDHQANSMGEFTRWHCARQMSHGRLCRIQAGGTRCNARR